MFGYNVDKIRKYFTVLDNNVIYFDSACMALKPKQVVDKLIEYYNKYPGCAGRSAHQFAEKVEEEVAQSREEVRKLINAKSEKEIIFTRNTTEGINIVANSISEGEVIISDKEHNSNLIPWLKKGLKVVVVDSNEDNTFNMDNFKKAFTENTKLVSIVHTSNLDGVSNPIKEIVEFAHSKNVKVLVDAAQSVPHKEVDVKVLDVDYLCFSGHKMLGPTGTGVLYGKEELLLELPQFIVGGETVIDSTYESYTEEALPMKFEAGLQDYAGIIALGEACKYLRKIGLKKIHEHEVKLNKIVTEGLPDVELIGPKDPELRGGIFSFNIKGMDPHHVSRILDKSANIMTRSGAHCVHSWFNKHEMKGSVRASMYLYNTEEEAKLFIEEVKKVIELEKV
tara:strand:+ start:263 stop:1444 length:1182 start_codon:yes stop_codon:yes gene_type:complete